MQETPLRVLVVEDCNDLRDTLALLLRAWGHEVRLAWDGPSALAVTRAFRPQAVLLDVGLRGMNGWEVARRLREQGDLQPLLLVALTGYAGEQDQARSRAAGFDAHLAKPADPVDLRRLLATATGALTPGRGGCQGPPEECGELQVTPMSSDDTPPSDFASTGRRGEDRRKTGTGRRQRDIPVAVERRSGKDRRMQGERRRQVDPTTCEKDYSEEEVAFMRAMDQYKRANRRPFPTWSEVLEVLRSLGYRKTEAATALPGLPADPTANGARRGG